MVVAPGAPEDVDYRELYANFLELARFPPLSRPLGPEQLDLLAPNARHEGPMVLGEPEGNRRLGPDELTYARFTGDRFALSAAEALTVTLKVWKGTAEGPGLPVEIESLTAIAFGPWGEEEVGAIAVQPVTGADTSYRAVIRPGALGATRVGDYRLELFFRAPDGGPVQARLDFHYTPATAVPARFTGKFRDEVRNGSLIVAAELGVARAGIYDVTANLFDEQARPIGWSRFLQELDAGTQWIDLTFFGLIFHEQHAAGRFELRSLRGMRVMPGETPDRELMAEPPAPHRTQAYRLEDFSSAEWDGPEKQAQIQMYEQRIREQEGGESPP